MPHPRPLNNSRQAYPFSPGNHLDAANWPFVFDILLKGFDIGIVTDIEFLIEPYGRGGDGDSIF